MRSVRYSRVSRCSVKMMIFSPVIIVLSVSSSRSSVHFLSVPLCLTRRASSIRSARSASSLSSSAIVRAAVAASATSDSISSASSPGRSSLSMAPSVGQVGIGGIFTEEVAQAPGEVVVRARAAAVAHLAAALLQALVASFERLEDRLRRGRQASLQDREGEADGEAALLITGVAQPVGEVHLVADVLGDGVVEDLLVLGQLVGDGVGAALGEQRLALERLEVLLDHPAHQPVGVHGVHRVAIPALEPVGVEQRHEQLEVLLAARVRGRGHQQEMPRGLPEELAELVALGLLQLVAEVMRGHPVRLIDHDQVPVGALQLLLELVGPGELVHPRDQQVVPGEDVAVRLRVRELPGQQLEGQAELLPQLVLPLLDKPAGRDDQAALQVTAEHQLLDIEARHDRLACAGVVGEQEPQRGPLDQLAVDGLDLVRERFEVGGVDREHRVEPRRPS